VVAQFLSQPLSQPLAIERRNRKQFVTGKRLADRNTDSPINSEAVTHARRVRMRREGGRAPGLSRRPDEKITSYHSTQPAYPTHPHTTPHTSPIQSFTQSAGRHAPYWPTCGWRRPSMPPQLTRYTEPMTAANSAGRWRQTRRHCSSSSSSRGRRGGLVERITSVTAAWTC
jgi:hypothetical protein